jgi:hypothetical protein
MFGVQYASRPLWIKVLAITQWRGFIFQENEVLLIRVVKLKRMRWPACLTHINEIEMQIHL